MGEINERGVTLHYLCIPWEIKLPVNERFVRLKSFTVSCDAAHYIPLLLHNEFPVLAGGKNWSTIVPVPTFNECLSSNVCLFLFERSAFHSNAQTRVNTRGKYYFDLFKHKYANDDVVMTGNVFLFWRESVDEHKHEMTLQSLRLHDLQSIEQLAFLESPSFSLKNHPSYCKLVTLLLSNLCVLQNRSDHHGGGDRNDGGAHQKDKKGFYSYSSAGLEDGDALFNFYAKSSKQQASFAELPENALFEKTPHMNANVRNLLGLLNTTETASAATNYEKELEKQNKVLISLQFQLNCQMKEISRLKFENFWLRDEILKLQKMIAEYK